MSILQFYPTLFHESERQTSKVIWLNNKTTGLRLFSVWKAYWSYFCPALISKISALDLGKIMCVIWHPSHVVCYAFKTLSSIDIIIPIPILICLSMMIPIYRFGFISNRYQYISVWLFMCFQQKCPDFLQKISRILDPKVPSFRRSCQSILKKKIT